MFDVPDYQNVKMNVEHRTLNVQRRMENRAGNRPGGQMAAESFVALLSQRFDD
jgi:hypothetical protein